MNAKSKDKADAKSLLTELCTVLEPLGGDAFVQLLEDKRTGAKFCECQIRGSKLIDLGTTDAPLDPDDQSEYRANREIVENATAFQIMKEDAFKERSFSNIVAEYSKEWHPEKPLKL